MTIINWQSDKNKNQDICYRLDTEIYPVMLLNFLIDMWKVIFKKATFEKKIDLFLSHHFLAHYKSPCLGLKSLF